MKSTLKAAVRRLAAYTPFLAAASVLAGPAASAHAAPSSQSAAQQFRQSMAAVLHLNRDRGPLHHVDLSSLKAKVSSEILAGPTNGLESGFIVYTRMAPDAAPIGLYTLPTEQTYLVLKGRLNVQIGTDRFVAEPDTLVLVPKGVPHQAWNAGAEQEADLEVVAPAPARSLVAMMQPAKARAIPDAAQYVHVPPPVGKLHGNAHQISFNERVVASRAMGSDVMERLGEILPGSKTHPFHIHPFDQLYFVRSGTMTFDYGLRTYRIPADTLIVIPSGLVHTDHNDAKSVLSFVQLIIPQPKDGVPFAVGVHFDKSPGRGRSSRK